MFTSIPWNLPVHCPAVDSVPTTCDQHVILLDFGFWFSLIDPISTARDRHMVFFRNGSSGSYGNVISYIKPTLESKYAYLWVQHKQWQQAE